MKVKAHPATANTMPRLNLTHKGYWQMIWRGKKSKDNSVLGSSGPNCYLHKSHRHKERYRCGGLKKITLSCFFFTGIHGWSYSDSKGCFSPALCWLSGGGPGDDTVHKRADLICLSVCECHTVSECDRAAHPTCCANHNLPPTVCFLRGRRRKGICKAKNNFLAMSSGAEGEIRSKLSGHRGSNS